ncbi:MAG TPA: hypothetical protein VGH99_13480 [Pseudonocardia sp.]|jgi:hypothetical protein
MRTDGTTGKVDTRSAPLPEEAAAERGGEDRRSEAAEILTESEQRVAEATEADTPADAAAEHRRSEDTTPS